MLTIITPTCDQPTGIRLCEHYMQRQTIWGAAPIQWLVIDDGVEAARLTMGQVHVRRQREPDCAGAQSLCRNLLAALPLVAGDVVAFVEHDDWYRADHLETVCKQLDGPALIAGDDRQRYYNVTHRLWRIFQNKGASLCQTAIKASMLPRLEAVARECLASSRFYIDFKLWMSTTQGEQSIMRTDSVLGIKGLPGRPGLGIGHRPQGAEWTADRDFAQLQAWIGADAALYESIVAP